MVYVELGFGIIKCPVFLYLSYEVISKKWGNNAGNESWLNCKPYYIASKYGFVSCNYEKNYFGNILEIFMK